MLLSFHVFLVILSLFYHDSLMLKIDGKNLYFFCTTTDILFFTTVPVLEDSLHRPLHFIGHYSLNYQCLNTRGCIFESLTVVLYGVCDSFKWVHSNTTHQNKSSIAKTFTYIIELLKFLVVFNIVWLLKKCNCCENRFVHLMLV